MVYRYNYLKLPSHFFFFFFKCDGKASFQATAPVGRSLVSLMCSSGRLCSKCVSSLSSHCDGILGVCGWFLLDKKNKTIGCCNSLSTGDILGETKMVSKVTKIFTSQS